MFVLEERTGLRAIVLAQSFDGQIRIDEDVDPLEQQDPPARGGAQRLPLQAQPGTVVPDQVEVVVGVLQVQGLPGSNQDENQRIGHPQVGLRAHGVQPLKVVGGGAEPDAVRSQLPARPDQGDGPVEGAVRIGTVPRPFEEAFLSSLDPWSVNNPDRAAAPAEFRAPGEPGQGFAWALFNSWIKCR